ncbi:MAG: DUF819 family protein [Planctomycetota bacterium]|nr:MAG: DUF819 family protein [Planctomycetota bacterium]
MTDPIFVIAVLGANVAVAEWLARKTILRHLGAALLVIVVTAVTANVGLIPTVTGGSPVYDGVFTYVAPLAIFWLLLQVNLRSILKAGLPMVGLFVIGSLATVAGVFVGMWAVDGAEAFGDVYRALGGMFVGTYTGGSANFNAIALEYHVVEDGALYAGANVVDSAMTTLWMAASVALPRVLAGVWPAVRKSLAPHGAAGATGELITGIEDDTESVHPVDLAILLALGAFAVWASAHASEWLGAALGGRRVPSIIVLTTLALVLAQLGPIQRLTGTRLCGMFAVMIFLAVIGALCDISALLGMGTLGAKLALFVTITVLVHGTLVYASAALLRLDPAMAAVASQANIGGGTSALALARSLGRPDLVLPAILIGSLGTALGTYLGFLTVGWLP